VLRQTLELICAALRAAVVDETGFVKKGSQSVGEARGNIPGRPDG
jgi:SRSO17 transposase